MSTIKPKLDTSTVYRYLDLCTNHLTEFEANNADASPVLRVIEHEHGMWVHVSQDTAEDFAEIEADEGWAAYPNLLACIQFARACGDTVFWINFDRDGVNVEGLPTFEW